MSFGHWLDRLKSRIRNRNGRPMRRRSRRNHDVVHRRGLLQQFYVSSKCENLEDRTLLTVTLSAADIVVVGYSADAPDEFAVMPLVDLSAGDVIHFTDRGWDSGAGDFTTADAGATTFDITYTVPGGGVTAGTVLDDADLGVDISGITNALSSLGDQVLIFQTDNNLFSGTPTFIYAFNANDRTDSGDDGPSDGWIDDGELGNQGTESNLPPSLVAVTSQGGTGSAFGWAHINGGEVDNLKYSGPETATDKDGWIGRIHNTANWTTDNSSSISVQSSDFPHGSPGSGTFPVSGGNTTPTISIDNSNLNYTEGEAAKQIDGAGTVSDADGDADWNGGTLEVQITASNEAADAISISDTDGDGTAITVSGTNIFANGTDIGDLSASGGTVTNGTKLTITFDGDATNASVQEVLQSLRYSNSSQDPGTSNRTITITATDTNSASAVDTRTVSVAAENDAPTATGIPSDVTVTEDVASNVDLSAVTFTDVDGDSLTVTLTASAGTWTATTGGGVTVGGSGTGTVTLAGTAANINTFLDTTTNVKYTGASNVSGNDAASFTVKANDGTVNPTLGTVNLDITAVNDDPTAAGVPSDVTVTEDVASNVDFSAISFADVDSGTITVTLTASAGTFSTPADGAGVGGGVTETLVSATVITLVGAPADINTYLDTASNIKYTGASNVSGNDAATITVTANDGDGSGNINLGTVNVDITAVNDEPTLSTTASNPTFTEGGAAASLFTGTSVSTVESGQTVSGLTLTITNVTNGSNERLNVDGTTIVLTHGTSGTTASNSLNYSVSVIGTTATLSLTGGTLSTAATQTLVDNLSYQNNSNAPNTSNRVVTLTSLQDSGGTANGGDNTASLATASTVTVVQNNDEPTLSANASNPTFTEGGAAASLFSGSSISTVEAGQLIQGLTLTITNVTNGSSERLNVDGTAIILTHGTSGTTASNSLNYSVSLVGTTATLSLTGGT
ncbi:MAG: beta strand repeat-containing protein, partial [Planctomycetota bacterium]